MRYKDFAVPKEIALPVIDHFPEPEVTTAYFVYPQRIKHLNMINRVAAQLAEIALKNMDKPTSEEWRLGVQKFIDVQRKADQAYAKYLELQKKKKPKST
jgi:hypothetical protein